MLLDNKWFFLFTNVYFDRKTFVNIFYITFVEHKVYNYARPFTAIFAT